MKNQRITLLIPVIILSLLSFLLYVETIRFGYNGDDDVFIAENTITKSGFARISEIFTDDGAMKGWLETDNSTIEEQGFRKRYRPIAQFTFATEVALFGINPHISHLINIMLFVVSVLLIFSIARKFRLSENPWYFSFAFWVALIFAAHPIHTEVVANIKSRDEILALFFFLLAFWVSLKQIRFKFFIIFFLFLLSLLSKENAVVFLAIIPLSYHFILKEKLNLKKHLQLLGPFLIAGLIFGLLSYIVLKDNNPDWNKNVFSDYFLFLSPSEKYGTILVSLGKYMQLLILPLNLFCDYSVYQVPIFKITHFLPLGILLIHFIFFFVAVKSLIIKSLYSYAIFFYFISMSVYSNLFFSTGTAVAERFLYIPSIAFCYAFAYFLTIHLPSFFKEKKYIFPGLLMFAFLTYFAAKTIYRSSDWENTATILTADVSKKNNCARLNNSYAELFFDGKKEDAHKKDSIRTAIEYYKKAVKIYPQYINALNQLGTAYYYLGKHDSASFYFYQSLLQKSDQLQVYKNITIAIDSMQKGPNTTDLRKKLIALSPGLPPLYYTLAKDYKMLGQKDSAILYYEKSLQLNPNLSKARIELEQLKE